MIVVIDLGVLEGWKAGAGLEVRESLLTRVTRTMSESLIHTPPTPPCP